MRACVGVDVCAYACHVWVSVVEVMATTALLALRAGHIALVDAAL